MSKISRFRQLRKTAEAFLDENGLPGEIKMSRWRRFVHFWVLVWRSFTRNRCPVRASALAYATLLALIPMLAVVMSITSSFLKKEGEAGIEKFIIKLVDSVTPPAAISTNAVDNASGTVSQKSSNSGDTETAEVLANQKAAATQKAVAGNINEFIQNTQSGALGVTGSVLLIFAAISMLSRIEATFNDIWGVARGRSWFMRIVLYWGVLSLAPILLVVALGLATGPHLEGTKRFVATMPVIGSFLFHFGFQLLPVLVLCLTFATFYMLMPNTRVHWRAALAGGLVGGILFHLNNMFSVLYVSRVVSNSKIYGSLGLVPVFMIGLYFSWLILLFGAQVAYAFQNRRTYLQDKLVENVNQRGREFIALRLMTYIGQCFQEGRPPATVSAISIEFDVPGRLVQQI